MKAFKHLNTYELTQFFKASLARITGTLAILLLSVPHAAECAALDIWIGTLEVRDNAVYLKRCDVASETYLLKPYQAGAQLPKLPLSEVSQGKPVTATLIAAYEESEKGGHILLVDSVSKIELNKSCHLTDLL